MLLGRRRSAAAPASGEQTYPGVDNATSAELLRLARRAGEMCRGDSVLVAAAEDAAILATVDPVRAILDFRHALELRCPEAA
jgi:hypothetical protein